MSKNLRIYVDRVQWCPLWNFGGKIWIREETDFNGFNDRKMAVISFNAQFKRWILMLIRPNNSSSSFFSYKEDVMKKKKKGKINEVMNI